MTRGWIPLVLMAGLIGGLGAYTRCAVRVPEQVEHQQPAAHDMPLELVSMGQTFAMLVGGFDVSVAALITMCVVIASFTLTPDELGIRARARLARDPRRGHRDRALQRDPDPGAAAPVDHRDARHAQHPRGRVAAGCAHPEGAINIDVIERR